MTNESIAKRYAKAITELVSGQELDTFATHLEEASALFGLKKFTDIMLSPDVSGNDKKELILGSINNPSKGFSNLVQLLAEKERFAIIPDISSQIAKQIAANNNVYVGKLISGFAVSNEKIAELESELGSKFKCTVKLENIVTDFSGIKVELDELGVEVSFSLDRLKSQMSEHILKAI